MRRLIRCLVVDDEQYARVLLETYIQKIPSLELVASCRESLEAIGMLQVEQIDLLFLDIQMPELTGVELLQTLQHKPLVIFTTAYEEYALEGYQLDIVDYLLKPFRFERFAQAVNKASRRLRASVEIFHSSGQAHPATKTSALPEKEYLLIKAEHKIHKVAYADIRYIQGMKEYVAFLLERGRILSLQSLKSLEEQLPDDRFIRIHRSYIVAIHRVDALEGNLLRVGSDLLPIGGSYKEAVVKRIFE